MKSFWKKKTVKNYIVNDYKDLDLKVLFFGSWGLENEGKIQYIYVPLQEETNIYSKEIIYYDNKEECEKTNFLYRKVINYNEFINEFDFEKFKDFYETNAERLQQTYFLNSLKKEFYKTKNNIVCKQFLKDVINLLNESIEELKILKESNLNEIFFSKYHNYIHDYLIHKTILSFNDCILKIKEEYKGIDKELDSIFFSTKSDSVILSRDEILNKLIDGTKNLVKFNNYEEILKKENYISKDSGNWLQSSASLIRFYNYLEKNNIIKYHYAQNTKGVQLIRDLYSFHEGTHIDLPNKRKKQSENKNHREFHILLD